MTVATPARAVRRIVIRIIDFLQFEAKRGCLAVATPTFVTKTRQTQAKTTQWANSAETLYWFLENSTESGSREVGCAAGSPGVGWGRHPWHAKAALPEIADTEPVPDGGDAEFTDVQDGLSRSANVGVHPLVENRDNFLRGTDASADQKQGHEG
jgi:hypothetical protein